MSKSIQILGTEIKPGTSHKLSIDFAKLYTRTKIEVPVIIERAKEDGPTLLLCAGIHGDEVNGVEIVRQIISKGINKPKRGMIICIPLINVFGFLNSTRAFPDGRDLNRVFPGSKSGSLASRFAHHLINEIVPYTDYILDFHTGGAQRFNITQLRISQEEETLELAKKLNIPFVLFSNQRKETFRESCVKLGKKVILFEGGKSLFLDKQVTKKGIDAAEKMIQALNMAPQDDSPIISPILIAKNKWIRASKSGMFRSYIGNGSKIKKGEIIGTITDPFGQFEIKVKSSQEGYIICINHFPLVNQGDAIINIGIEIEA